MERWQEIFIGRIPKDVYQTKMINGEEKGLVLDLKSNNHHVIVMFGIVRAVRMLDEGIVQNALYSDKEMEKYKGNHFENIIYEVQGGDFENQIQRIADGYWEALDVKHYVIITQNYNIDIITEWEPEIEVL